MDADDDFVVHGGFVLFAQIAGSGEGFDVVLAGVCGLRVDAHFEVVW